MAPTKVMIEFVRSIGSLSKTNRPAFHSQTGAGAWMFCLVSNVVWLG
jgi:hypothetical protein